MPFTAPDFDIHLTDSYFYLKAEYIDMEELEKSLEETIRK
jgi:hypothetical protein